MGTSIQARHLSHDDFEGKEGCNEYLVLTRPDVIAEIHAGYLSVGCHGVETDTFGGSPITLADYHLEERAYEINHAAAELARKVCSDFATPNQPRYVIGSIGPGTKSPTLEHITYDEVFDAHAIQARGLLDGGADVLLIETCFDLLQAKAAVAACIEAMKRCGRQVSLMVQVTMENTGTMLLGSDMAAVVSTLEALPVDVIGMNCATGPDAMTEHVRYLSENCRRFLSVLPNAGLPEVREGKSHYPLTPEELARYHRMFVGEYGVNIVGGCCGTTPEHLKAVVEAVKPLTPKSRRPEFQPSVTSLYQSVTLAQESSVLIVGERTNANGSRKFRDLLLQEQYDDLVDIAREQQQEGAHVLDVCVDYVGRDGARDMDELVRRFAVQVPLPLVFDSTEPPVLEAALKRYPGKAILNSINLEDGEVRMSRVLPLCRKYGAAVIALTIDEQGQPHDTEGKVRIAKRIHQLATEKYGIEPSNLLFDALTFTLGTGQEDYRKDGVATIEAVRRIKSELPGCYTLLGVSNVSFGLSPAARQVLNSVFLHYCREAGLDAAIVNAQRILPLNRIPEEQREMARQLIFDERKPDFDPLTAFMALFDGKGTSKAARLQDGDQDLPLEERLKRRIIDGIKPGIEALLDEALHRYKPLEIINQILLDGMKVVGDLFGSGQMQLPFVLQSAEVMKAAVGYLERFMEHADTGGKGAIVLATVKGDVHDIGKNLVDIILSNNGYTVYNLGIKQPINQIIETAGRVSADAIGLSGLLVKSTLVMREDLEELNERNLFQYPVLLGGAALTRQYVEQDLRAVYKGKVFYGQDAFEGLALMEELMGHRQPDAVARAYPEADSEAEKGTERPAALQRRGEVPAAAFTFTERSETPPAAHIPTPPFWGSRVVESVDLRRIFPYVNEIALFRGQWQFKRGNMQADEYDEFLNEEVRPLFQHWQDRCIKEGILEPRVVYGYFPCQSSGNDLIVYRIPKQNTPDLKTLERSHLEEWVRFTFPRQLSDRRLCLADFFRSIDSNEYDVAAFQLVTMGSRATELEQAYFRDNAYRDYLYLHGLSVETAEALAEYWHQQVRRELHIDQDDSTDIRQIFAQHYQGSRYSFGYPACPRLEDEEQIFELLCPDRIGVVLSEEYQLHPEQSTSAMVVHHPDAKYFNIR